MPLADWPSAVRVALNYVQRFISALITVEHWHMQTVISVL
jgi:hypothetical protein